MEFFDLEPPHSTLLTDWINTLRRTR